MDNFTRQELLHLAVIRRGLRHLRKTKTKSTFSDIGGNGGVCTYLGCGCIIAPSLLPGHPLSTEAIFVVLMHFSEWVKPSLKRADPVFLNEVQQAHDFCDSHAGVAFLKDLESNLKNLINNNFPNPQRAMQIVGLTKGDSDE